MKDLNELPRTLRQEVEPPKQHPDHEPKRYIGLRLKGNHSYDIVDVDIGLLHKKLIIKSFFATKDIIYNPVDLDTVAKV